MIKAGDYIVAVRDMYMTNGTKERIITKDKWYQIVNINEYYFTFDDDLIIRANFDVEFLDERSNRHLFDTLQNVRRKKILSIL